MLRISTISPLLAALLAPACHPAGSVEPASSASFEVPEHPAALPLDASRWEYLADDAEVEQHLGRTALRLRGGFALLRDVELAEGVIELDMAFGPGTAFAGVAWHVQDPSTFERFYLRTFLSGSREATQYTPYFHDVSGWQLYHGPGYNAKARLPQDEWIPVRVVVSGGRAEVFVGDANEPTLAIPRLALGATGGRVGLFVEPLPTSWGQVPIWFSNVRITEATAPALMSPAPARTARPGRVPQWLVSEAFSSARIDALDVLPVTEAAAHRWTTLASDSDGLANLARVQGVTEECDTAFARVTINADHERLVRLDFGFSERIRVYLDGRLLYAGADDWHSRDITFQGVVGWSDALWLPLHPGDNELWVAVTENVEMRGGWGVLAALEDLEGLRFSLP